MYSQDQLSLTNITQTVASQEIKKIFTSVNTERQVANELPSDDLELIR